MENFWRFCCYWRQGAAQLLYREAPFRRVWLIVRSSGSVEVGHCTCMAGLAETCLYVGALLFGIVAAARSFSDTSSTSGANEWIVPNPVRETLYLILGDIFAANLCESSSAAPVCGPTDDEKKHTFEQLSKTTNKPIILSLVQALHKASKQVKKPSFLIFLHCISQKTAAWIFPPCSSERMNLK